MYWLAGKWLDGSLVRWLVGLVGLLGRLLVGRLVGGLGW